MRTIELYGRLRDAGRGPAVSVALPPRAVASQVLEAVRPLLSTSLAGCAVAAADRVLAPAERVPAKGRLAILPPVCGG